MSTSIEELYDQYRVDLAASTGTRGLAQALFPFDALAEHKEKVRVFNSTPSTDPYYPEAQFATALCDICKSLSDITVPFPKDAERNVAKACKAIASRNARLYGGFAYYAMNTFIALLSKWKIVYAGMLDVYHEQQTTLNAQAARLRNAGALSGTYAAQYKAKTSENESVLKLLENKDWAMSHCAGSLMKELANNLEDPDSFGALTLLLLRMASSVEGMKGSNLRQSEVADILTANSNKAKREAEAARKKAEREVEEARRKAKKMAVSAWWEQHAEEKKDLEARERALKDQIVVATREHDEWQRRHSGYLEKLNPSELSEAEKEVQKATSKAESLSSAILQLESMREAIGKRPLPPTPSEKSLVGKKDDINLARTRLNELFARRVEVNDNELPSSGERDSLEKEIDSLEQELSSLGFFSWGRKRQLKGLLDQKRDKLASAEKRVDNERDREAVRLRAEHVKAINDLKIEIDNLEAEAKEIEKKIPEEREAAAAEAAREAAGEIESISRQEAAAKKKLVEQQVLVKEAGERVAQEKGARAAEWQPKVAEAQERIREAAATKQSLEKELTRVVQELKNPNIPQEFLAGFLPKENAAQEMP